MTCFSSSYEPSSGWLLFLSKTKYTVNNAIVIVTYEITYNMYKTLKKNWFHYTLTIALLIVYFALLRKSNQPEDGS